MEKHKAHSIMEKYHLVPGPISRKILDAIIKDVSIHEESYSEFVSTEQINDLRKRYKDQQKKLVNAVKKRPRYWTFYKILCDMYPATTVESLLFPRIYNLRLSFLSLLLGKTDIDVDLTFTKKYLFFDLPKRTARILTSFLGEAKAIYPKQQDMQKILEWLSLNQSGNESTIFIPICPDYAVESTGNINCPYRHTFDALGFGLGPVALRILDVLPLLKSMLDALNIFPSIVIGIADFEAFSANNLKSFNLTEQEFLSRVTKSKEEFEKKSCVAVIRITDLAGDKQNWLKHLNAIRAEFSRGNFGSAHINHNVLLDITKKRKALYTRWYGEKSSIEAYIPIVLDQGAEYATMGAFIAKELVNCLIIGADANVFVPFYSYAKPMATLYLEKNYC